ILITLLSVVLLLSLISCNTQKYRDDQAVAELAGKAVTALNDGLKVKAGFDFNVVKLNYNDISAEF
ncbi:MAG: hypothetical protein IIU97_01995, partial [Bacteroidaceae bacterium]|nr:hypothetical protein [Bacteroidaceae bacterium]